MNRKKFGTIAILLVLCFGFGYAQLRSIFSTIDASNITNELTDSAHSLSIHATSETLPIHHILGLALMAAFSLLWLRNRRRCISIFNFEDVNARGADAAYFSRIAAHMSGAQTPPSPRRLWLDAFDQSAEDVIFDGRVEFAIDRSLLASRVIGVVHLDVRPGMTSDVVASKAIRMNILADTIRANLPEGDFLRITGEWEISVFACMLDTRETLIKKAGDLECIIRRCNSTSAATFGFKTGTAMYPIDGYCASDLIDAARENAFRKTRFAGNVSNGTSAAETGADFCRIPFAAA